MIYDNKQLHMHEDELREKALGSVLPIAYNLRRRLRAARVPEDFEDITAYLHNEADEIFRLLLRLSGSKIACKENCYYCCYIKVDAKPHEIFSIVEFLKRRLKKEDVEAIHAQARANREIIMKFTAEQQLRTNIPCPLLKNGCCIAYEVRPIVCRKYHAKDSIGCQNAFVSPDTFVPADEIMELTVSLSTLSVAVQNVFSKEGYHVSPYDLSSALDEALSNPKCYKRWRDRKAPFPREIIAKDWEDSASFTLPGLE